MENNKSKAARRGNNRRKSGGSYNKENKREVERMKKSRSEESVQWPCYSVSDNENRTDDIAEDASLDLGNFDNGDESNIKSSFMCPALRRQLETHRNVLRLLHEHKLVSTQINGQRILSIQPVRWTGPVPGIDCEIFVGRIPKTIYEDTLYPLFSTIGEVFQIRLMVDMAELTRGYCFIMYTNPENAGRAIVQLDQYEISPGKKIRVLASVNKCKLYIGPLPWHIPSEEVVRVIYASAWDIEYVSIYRFPSNDAAYAIVSFKSHRNAALARRKLRPEKLFKCNEVHVEWAHVDWSPSNVYEDHGTVDNKGEVKITRKYLQSSNKRMTTLPASVPPQGETNRRQKQLPPICPPSSLGTNKNDNPDNPAIKLARNHTRYATMMSMSAKLNEFTSSCDEKKNPETLTDINDNVQRLDILQDQQQQQQQQQWVQRKSEIDEATDSFRNFDMWSSNLVSQLPGSSESSGSSNKNSPNTTTRELFARDCENDATRYHPVSRAMSSSSSSSSFVNRNAGNHRCYSSGVSNYRYPGRNNNSRFFGRTIGQNQPNVAAAADAVRYQALAYQNCTPCYIVLPSQSYLRPKDAPVTYPPSSFVNGEQQATVFGTNCERRSFLYDGENHVGSIAIDRDLVVVGDSRREGVSAKSEIATTDVASVVYSDQAYSSSMMLNFMPIYASENTEMTPCFVAFDATNGERRPRAILKHGGRARL